MDTIITYADHFLLEVTVSILEQNSYADPLSNQSVILDKLRDHKQM